jgi:peptidyl-prolyl cis-trans isomerase B (cyclophilin B)
VSPRPFPILGLVLLGALGVTGCGGGDDRSDKAGTSGNQAAGCQDAQAAKPRPAKKRKPPTFELSPDRTYTATVVTNCGTFEIRLDPKQAPRTGGSFATLVREELYNGLTFHRIVKGFVIQGGDPLGNGMGGPGYTIRERPPQDTVYSEGVVAMAKTGAEPPGTSGSQFFVVTADASLPPDYALLGHVTKGLDVVHRIESVPAGADGFPTRPVVIQKIDLAVT